MNTGSLKHVTETLKNVEKIPDLLFSVILLLTNIYFYDANCVMQYKPVQGLYQLYYIYNANCWHERMVIIVLDI